MFTVSYLREIDTLSMTFLEEYQVYILLFTIRYAEYLRCAVDVVIVIIIPTS